MIHEYRRWGGFTLVELLVALVIMASLVAVASVSVESTQSRARADKTAAIGRGVVEALERSDGLSFVSDFGRLPEGKEELMFLFSQKVFVTGPPGHTSKQYETHPLALPLDTKYEPFRNYFNHRSPKLGAGWRGPYGEVTAFRSVETSSGRKNELFDGWGNKLRLSIDSSEYGEEYEDQYILVSHGRDDDRGGSDWQDEDQVFKVERDRMTTRVEQSVRVELFDSGGFPVPESGGFTLYTILFTPKSSSMFSDVSIEAIPETSHSSTLTLTNVSIGQRMLFVCALNDGKYYVTSPRLLHIKAGINPIAKFMLTQINAGETGH